MEIRGTVVRIGKEGCVVNGAAGGAYAFDTRHHLLRRETLVLQLA